MRKTQGWWKEALKIEPTWILSILLYIPYFILPPFQLQGSCQLYLEEARCRSAAGLPVGAAGRAGGWSLRPAEEGRNAASQAGGRDRPSGEAPTYLLWHEPAEVQNATVRVIIILNQFVL